jgi:hypothetical protein
VPERVPEREMLKLTFEIRQLCGCVVAQLG